MTTRKITSRTTVDDVIAMLREDGYADVATEAGYRDSDPLPKREAHERPTPEAFRQRSARALRRTATEIRRAARSGALLWTSERLTTTDASALDLRADPVDA